MSSRNEIRKEIQEIKSELSKKKKDKKKEKDKDSEPSELQLPIDPLKQQYLENIKLYSFKKNEIPKKGTTCNQVLVKVYGKLNVTLSSLLFNAFYISLYCSSIIKTNYTIYIK